jgi:hypothetical protein
MLDRSRILSWKIGLRLETRAPSYGAERAHQEEEDQHREDPPVDQPHQLLRHLSRLGLGVPFKLSFDRADRVRVGRRLFEILDIVLLVRRKFPGEFMGRSAHLARPCLSGAWLWYPFHLHYLRCSTTARPDETAYMISFWVATGGQAGC